MTLPARDPDGGGRERDGGVDADPRIWRQDVELGQQICTHEQPGPPRLRDPETRARMKVSAVSVWIKAPVDVLLSRVQRKDDRPLLKTGDPREVLERLLKERAPIYAEADFAVESENGPHAETVERIVAALKERGVCME